MEIMDSQPSDEALRLFVLGVTTERLQYLKYLKFRGIAVDDREIAELEAELAQDQRNPDGDSIIERYVDDLQLQLAFVDLLNERSSRAIKAVLYQRGHVKVRMRQEQNHHRPHFHIEYKGEYSASYSVDTLERLAGEMPKRYEGPILEWASAKQQFLTANWEQLNGTVIERDGA
jgi:hypothetical protein